MNNFPKVVTQQRRGRASNPRLLDRKSDALPLSHRVFVFFFIHQIQPLAAICLINVLLLFCFIFSFVYFLFLVLCVLCVFYNYCCLVRINKCMDGMDG